MTCGGGARSEAGHSPAPGHACHGSPVAGNFQHRWRYGMGGVRRVLTPLENRASLSNVATQEGVVSSQSFSFLRPFVAGLGEPDNFAQACETAECFFPTARRWWQPLALHCCLALLHPLLVCPPTRHVNRISWHLRLRGTEESLKGTARGQVEENLVLDRWHGPHDGFAI